MTDDEYLKAYAEGFQDASLKWVRMTKGPFVITWIEGGTWRWHLETPITVSEAELLVEGMDDICSMLEDGIDEG